MKNLMQIIEKAEKKYGEFTSEELNSIHCFALALKLRPIQDYIQVLLLLK